ncbi:MAG: sugar phosphate isomerase/epimerase family protein [Phycisphaerales bacterium]
MKPAFSTVACPDWTLEEVVAAARRLGYLGVELRTEGFGSTRSACDPGLTAPAKARSLFASAGVGIVCLASGLRFDTPVTPPVVGRTFIFDQESSVRRGKALVDMAVQLECQYVRVFGFEVTNNESVASTVGRIADRLGKVVDYARNSGVTVLIENGGTFGTAATLSHILDSIDHPLLAASYSLPVARAQGELPGHGINVLGAKLAVAKVKDYANGLPCQLGTGEFDAQAGVAALRAAGFNGWVVYEHDRMWFPETGDPVPALESGAKTLFGWIADRHRSRAAH